MKNFMLKTEIKERNSSLGKRQENGLLSFVITIFLYNFKKMRGRISFEQTTFILVAMRKNIQFFLVQHKSIQSLNALLYHLIQFLYNQKKTIIILKIN